ncbi:MAG: hypothetical protein WCJ19_05505 [bacterium]
MLIIPLINGDNAQKCVSVTRILRGFVSIISINIGQCNTNLKELIKLFNKQQSEIELHIEGPDYEKRLGDIMNAHSDVNIGKVFFYTNNPAQVENDITNIRIFGIQPGLLINKENYNKPEIVNKFEYAIIEVSRVPDYIEIYKYIKNNDFKGSLLLNFGKERVPQDIITNTSIDGVYIDVTTNPTIKDTISSLRRAANSIY